MAIDRKKFSSTKLESLKSLDKEVNSKIRNFNSERTDWLEINKGINKFRIFPAHPNSQSFIFPRCTVWLDRQISYEKDGKKVDEIARRPIFNSKIHGGTEKDLVEEYFKFSLNYLQEELSNTQDPSEKKSIEEKLFNIQHWKIGIKYKTTWCCYANKIVNGEKYFGQLELTPGIKEKLNDLSVVEDSDSPIQTDPFTDPDDGKAIIINKTEENNKGRNETKYGVTIEFRGNYRLSDEELTNFSKVTPLSKVYQNSFKLSDFQLQLDGIKLYDKKNNIGVIELDSFLDIIKEIKSYYPDEINEIDQDIEEEQIDSSNKDEFDSMDRNELKKWIKNNVPDKKIIVRTTDDIESIKEKIRTFLELENADETTEDIEEQDDEFSSDDFRSKLGL